jgi:hypothetical protein
MNEIEFIVLIVVFIGISVILAAEFGAILMQEDEDEEDNNDH